MEIQILPEWKGEVLLGILSIDGIRVEEQIPALWDYIQESSRHYAKAFEGKTLAEIEGISKVRKLYRRFGLDPTKARPSSEALLRRCLKGKPLYQVNSAVDVCNLCSLRFLLPIGLYDTDKVEGDVAFRAGAEGEGYEGIQKGWINLHKKLTLCDGMGPFGNPSSDSDRTKITLDTTRISMVIFAPPDFRKDLLEEYLEEAASTMTRFNGGDVVQKEILY